MIHVITTQEDQPVKIQEVVRYMGREYSRREVGQAPNVKAALPIARKAETDMSSKYVTYEIHEA